MCNMSRAMNYLYWGLPGLVFAPSVFAADQAPPQTYHWPMWHGMHGHAFWWVFPLMFFVMLLVMFIFMMRRGGMSCLWCNRMVDGSEMKRHPGGQSETALEILNKRYARGEIDKQEYEEKKAAITLSTT